MNALRTEHFVDRYKVPCIVRVRTALRTSLYHILSVVLQWVRRTQGLPLKNGHFAPFIATAHQEYRLNMQRLSGLPLPTVEEERGHHAGVCRFALKRSDRTLDMKSRAGDWVESRGHPGRHCLRRRGCRQSLHRPGPLPSADIRHLMGGMAMLNRPDSRLDAIRYLDLP